MRGRRRVHGRDGTGRHGAGRGVHQRHPLARAAGSLVTGARARGLAHIELVHRRRKVFVGGLQHGAGHARQLSCGEISPCRKIVSDTLRAGIVKALGPACSRHSREFAGSLAGNSSDDHGLGLGGHVEGAWGHGGASTRYPAGVTGAAADLPSMPGPGLHILRRNVNENTTRAGRAAHPTQAARSSSAVHDLV